ncbi:hypothetical protein [Chitinophaga arvensicola]|uniref:Uncharacterized protein n=1 Tax=Chitinophaga arvensicola TaxID=29529 RepID=A0A1I0R9J2_9BACT|nr:hypothetical protein [Chitinophaga arvensicola]SEW37424.1 hypothetical protein SAMN04488122_2505 [Chitinophaga arvensicola]
MKESADEKKMPLRSVSIKIGSNDYTLHYPNTGQWIDIDVLKSQFSNGNYEKLKYSYDPGFLRSAITIDAVALLNVLVPKLKEDLTVKSLFMLDREKMDLVLEEYLVKVVPWLEQWEKLLSTPIAAKSE